MNGLGSRRAELVSGVFLPWVAEESSGPTTTNLDGDISCNEFQLQRSDTQ